ncbi:Uncharacterised protein [Campylobacter hyointestinalis subsp. hyointestinalis]|uniref:Uncharacterized protein n=1 Tax=Campylobacter hyointestinalis subsp. hyointestinalis TaxID=91352 RepID=A0A9W5EVH6_CAMHY|nr:hypothetical protein [Campylobacter hyointestinalis]CUU84929.1 Uncharacterised protein [Campylobacter hyointestinalis subsp. hyointestinalis]
MFGRKPEVIIPKEENSNRLFEILDNLVHEIIEKKSKNYKSAHLD